MRFAAFALALAALVGCQKQDAVPTPTPGQPAPQPGAPKPGAPKPGVPKGDSPKGAPPAGQLGAAPTDEDPEVMAYAKAKGWRIYTDMRIADGKRLVYLDVEDAKKPFDTVTATADDYKMMAKSKAAQVLNLTRVKCTDEGLKLIAASPRLEGIIVNGEGVTDAGLKALAGCKTLESVTVMSAEKVTDAGVKELAALPKLQALHLAFTKADGSAFEAFAGARALTALTIDYASDLTDAGAKHVAKLPNLNELKLKGGFGANKLTAAGIKAIVDARLPAKFEFDTKLIDDDLFAALVAKGWLYGPPLLGERSPRPATAADVKSISISGSKVTDTGFAAVLNCTNATSLFLDGSGITDETLKKLAAFKQLNYVALEKTKVTGAGLEALSGLPMKHVALQYCTLDEAAFKALGKMQALEELWLSDAKMQADWLKHLAGLPKLRELNLMSAALDDASVKHLLALPALKELTANNTTLGDTGFQELLKHAPLQRLLVDSTKVTKEVYQKAKKDHPKRSFYFYRYDM